MYAIRDKNGVLITQVSDHVGVNLVSECVGKWRQYKNSHFDGVCYEVTTDQVFGTNNFKIYLWKGTIIYKAKL